MLLTLASSRVRTQRLLVLPPLSVQIAGAEQATGYVPVAPIDFGNAVWQHAFSGARGTLGARAVSSQPQNRTISIAIRVTGSTKDEMAHRVSTLQALMEEMRRFGGTLTWKDAGQTYQQHAQVLAGLGSIKEYGDAEMRRNSLVFIVTLVCAPYFEGDPLDWRDDFSADTLTDGSWSVDAGAGTVFLDSNDHLAFTDTSVKRLRRTQPGYTPGQQQVTVELVTGSTLTNMKTGPGVRMDAGGADTGVFLYLTPTQIQLVKRVAGAETSLATTSYTPATATRYWLRLRAEISPSTLAHIITGDVFTGTTEPTPRQTPAATVTLADLSTDADFASLQTGLPGLRIRPAATSGYIASVRGEAYVFSATVSPTEVVLYDVPGDSNARFDLDITVKAAAGDNPPAWGLVAPTQQAFPGRLVGVVPTVTVLSATHATPTVDASAFSSGEKLLADAGQAAWSAEWLLQPQWGAPDDFTESEIDIEVWARMQIAPTTTGVRVAASIFPDPAGYGPIRYTAEWGSLGKPITPPTSGSGSGLWRLYRLGTLRLPFTPGDDITPHLRIDASRVTFPDNTFALDYLILTPARTRAAGPTGKPQDTTTYPYLISSFGWSTGVEVTKTLKADGSGVITQPRYPATRDHGLGQLLELAPADSTCVVKISSNVPDEPVTGGVVDQLGYTHTLHFGVVPRFALIRGA